MVENSPANAGHTGSTPGLGPKILHAAEQLSLSATTTESRRPRAHAPGQDEATGMRSPCSATRESPCTATKKEMKKDTSDHQALPFTTT